MCVPYVPDENVHGFPLGDSFAEGEENGFVLNEGFRRIARCEARNTE